MTPDRDRVQLASVARPKQQRSEDTLYRILDAAEALIEEKGLGDVSIPEIVRRAGSSVGGFYARFRDKNELLRALEERFFAELRVEVEGLSRPERWERVPLPEIVQALVGELIRNFRERSPMISAFMVRAAHDTGFVEEAVRFRRQVSDRIVALLLTRSDEMTHPDPATGIDLGVQLAFGLMLQRVVFGDLHAAGRRLAEPDLARELARSFSGYLGIAAPDTRRTP